MKRKKLVAEKERLNSLLEKVYNFEFEVDALRAKIEKLREAWKKIKCKYSDVGCGVGGEHTWQCELAQQVLKETE